MGRGLVLGLVLIGAGASGYYLGKRASPETNITDPVVEVRPSPSVITALRKLARLEGAQVHLERVIDLREKQSRFFGLVEVEDAILLVAAGDVVAGVDLTKMKASDLEVDEARRRVKITLPAAEIFSTRVDNERTYVHTRSTDALAESRTHLETEARKEAERTFEQAARESGLMDHAAAGVSRSVQALVQSLGFDEVEVVFRAETEPASSGVGRHREGPQ